MPTNFCVYFYFNVTIKSSNVYSFKSKNSTAISLIKVFLTSYVDEEEQLLLILQR